MSLNRAQIEATITPLRLIFWGGLLCVIDITFSETTNGRGWTFDILNDFLGTILITFGVFRLLSVEVHDAYRKVMIFVAVVAFLSCFDALHAHFIYRVPSLLTFLQNVLGIAALVAIVLFCIAMRWLCLEAQLNRSAQSWKTTFWLFVVIYLLPLGLFYLIAMISTATGQSFNLNLGPGALLLVIVFLIPLVHFFISTSRMKSEAQMEVEGRGT